MQIDLRNLDRVHTTSAESLESSSGQTAMRETDCYRAKWIFPTHSAPISDGYVTIQGGRIIEIGRGSRRDAIDLGNVALTAGFVNAHTHLDLSLTPRPEEPPPNFVDWLATIVEYRRESSGEAVSAIAAGIDELLQTGTTVVGDIATTDFSEPCLDEAGLWGIVYREVIGLNRHRYEPLLQWAFQAAEHRKNREAVRTGVSPHAPYSTSRQAYLQISELERSTPVATHWMESAEEVEFLHDGGGPMRDFLERLNALNPDWTPPSRIVPEYLGGNVHWILVHCNYVSDADLDVLEKLSEQQSLAGIVYCPRTHAWFGHEKHPWRELRERNIPVVLGTDSRATAPDLCVFSEAKFLFDHDLNADPGVLLDMLTTTGADVVGLGEHCGQLRVGRRADLAAIAIPDRKTTNPYELLFDQTSRPVGTMLNGYWVYEPLID